MKDGIEVIEIFSLLKRKALMIVLCGIIGLGSAFAVTNFMLTQLFESSIQLVVNNAGDGEQLNQGDIHSSWNLINTYREILVSPVVLNEVIDELQLNFNASDLRRQISVNSPAQTQILSFSVLNEDPLAARDIANSMAVIFQDVIFEIFHTRNVFIIMEGEASSSPATPNMTMNMAIGLTLGLMTGVGITFIGYYLDTKIKSKHELERLLNIPVMGLVPMLDQKDFK